MKRMYFYALVDKWYPGFSCNKIVILSLPDRHRAYCKHMATSMLSDYLEYCTKNLGLNLRRITSVKLASENFLHSFVITLLPADMVTGMAFPPPVLSR